MNIFPFDAGDVTNMGIFFENALSMHHTRKRTQKVAKTRTTSYNQ
jgi:hypothetical protein